MAPSHILQIFLRVTVQNQIGIAQRIVVDEVVQFRPLRHGHVQFILDPGAVNRDHSPIPEQQFHAAGVHVEFAGSFIVLHNRVLSALRHSYSCDLRDTVFFLIRFRTHSRQGRTGIFTSEENKKSEPFSYREKVRIFIVWCARRDSPSRALETPHRGVSAPRNAKRGARAVRIPSFTAP